MAARLPHIIKGEGEAEPARLLIRKILLQPLRKTLVIKEGRAHQPFSVGGVGGLGEPGTAGMPGAPGAAGMPGAPGTPGTEKSGSLAPHSPHSVAFISFVAPHCAHFLSRATSAVTGLKHIFNLLFSSLISHRPCKTKGYARDDPSMRLPRSTSG